VDGSMNFIYLSPLAVLDDYQIVCPVTEHRRKSSQWVYFKLTLLVFKSLRGETPSYLADDCQLIADSGRHRLRSADANALTVPRTNTRQGDRSFSVAGPKLWNSLPATPRQPVIELGRFRRLLKTFLFS